jgi:RND family efflux transporter MFP subunit
MIFDQSGRPRARISRWIPVTVFLLAIALSVVIIKNRPRPQPAEPEVSIAPEISVIEVANSSARPAVTTTGRVSSPHEIQVISRVSGIIESVSDSFRDGASFTKDALLVKVEDHDYLVALAQSEASLASSLQLLATEQGLSDQAKREWRDLGNTEANALFLREPQLNAAKAQAEAARSGVAQAKLNLQRTQIIAPFEGVISARHADVGQFITTGTPIASVHSTERVQINVSLTPNEISDLGWQGRRSLNLENMSAQIDYQNGRLSISQIGIIQHVSPLMDPMTQMTEVLVDLDEENLNSSPPSPGQFVEVRFTGEPIDNAVWVPQSALFEREQVLLANQGQLEIRAIDVVANADSKILVVGLDNGDLVVVNRPLWVFPGEEVTPVLAED